MVENNQKSPNSLINKDNFEQKQKYFRPDSLLWSGQIESSGGNEPDSKVWCHKTKNNQQKKTSL